MKVLVIGASGTIGQAIVAAISPQHEIITANYKSGDLQVDLSDPKSIQTMFKKAGKLDAVISAAGLASFASLSDHTDNDYQLALENKLMGQINLLRYGREYINKGGSITLTSGILSRQPMPGSASISMVNGALESYARAAALELESLRFNIVAPAFVKETMELMGMDSSYGISAADTAKAYIAALEGDQHGATLDVTDYI
ncbi:short chain dehydrogenase [Amphritea sp. HPY]|uniref:short chain dehydrogenase n=1 Tax=Amphritea sp. HPY TaxID=3421652 RepID=UPI003D7EA2E0